MTVGGPCIRSVRRGVSTTLWVTAADCDCPYVDARQIVERESTHSRPMKTSCTSGSAEAA